MAKFTVFLSDWDFENHMTYQVEATNPIEAEEECSKRALKEHGMEFTAKFIAAGWVENLLGRTETSVANPDYVEPVTEDDYIDIAKQLNCKFRCTVISGESVQAHFEGGEFSHYYCGYCGESVDHELNTI